VQPLQRSKNPNGPHFKSKDFEGNLDQWALRTKTRIYDYGFKGVGSWSHTALETIGIPFSRDLNMWVSAKGSEKLVFSTCFERRMNEIAENVIPSYRNNRDLIGYYLDNELNWSEEKIGLWRYFDGLPCDNPNRQFVLQKLKNLWVDIKWFNRDWQTEFTNWEELANQKDIPRTIGYELFKDRWYEIVARRYFSVTSQAIRSRDPNHLILGVRFNKRPPLGVLRGSVGFVDAHSLNIYNDEGYLWKNHIKEMHEVGNIPLIISEFSFYAPVNRSGNKNLKGFGGLVKDQQTRADSYIRFVSDVAACSFIIGANWFQWNDEPPHGRFDGEDCNFGVVDIHDTPYVELVAAVRTIRPKVNSIHATSDDRQRGRLWKDDPTYLKN
jgi:agarase